MFLYNVTVKVSMDRVDEWLSWMRDNHIPDVMQTGYFSEYRLCRLLDEGDLDGATFVIQYTFQLLDDFLNYQLTSAPQLQKHHMEKFGEDVVAFRTVMEVLD